MKKNRKQITIVLTLCMVIGLFAVTVSAAAPKKIYFLGDSVTTAYGTDVYTENAGYFMVDDREIVEGSYPSLVAKGLETEDFSSNAHCGWRVNEALAAAKGENPDAFAEMLLPILDTITVEGASVDFEAESAAIRNGIENADYISLNFGANDIFSYAVFSLIGSGSLNFESISLPDFSDIKSADDAANAVKSLIDTAKGAAALINEVERLVNEGLENFKTAYPLFLDCITEKCKDGAKVFVNSVIFPLQVRVDVTDTFTLSLYTIGDKIANEANSFLKNLCDAYENVYFVDTTKTENYDVADALSGLGSLDDPDAAFEIIAGLLKCAHADEAGHAYIAERLLDAINRANTKPENVRVSYNALGQVQVKWDKIDGAVSYTIFRATEPDGPYTAAATSSSANWTDALAPTDSTLYYKVVAAMDSNGYRLTEKSDAVEFSTVGQSVIGKMLTNILNTLVTIIRNTIRAPMEVTKIVSDVFKINIGI